MSYMEIYNEEINGLLAPEHCKLQIRKNIDACVPLKRDWLTWKLLHDRVSTVDVMRDSGCGFIHYDKSRKHVRRTRKEMQGHVSNPLGSDRHLVSYQMGSTPFTPSNSFGIRQLICG
ncbi:uncharacterized protein LOC113320740 isoform X2 [Papaver somniferum]|uniref:uncharacterized protein LOC113320740 isoform X2 n=1 Tax=Papaver somniferum TaxID=3469 RepID=UPI000E6F88BE|nr:uncharacterized protein LOC113320740 isoform X2 [Papaver somniferum]